MSLRADRTSAVSSPARRWLMVFGIVALCQPWSLFLHRYGRDDHPRRASIGFIDRHPRFAPPNAEAGLHGHEPWPQIELRDIEKYFGAVHVIRT